jgi:hypothetical protein
VTRSIGWIVRVPSRSGPTSRATVPSSTSSAVGICRVPIFSLSLSTRMPLILPSASRIGTWNIASPEPPGPPPSGRASASAMSAVTAEVNHLTPRSRHVPSSARDATVSDRPTSLPPARSVIHCPDVHASSGSREVSRRTASSSSAAPGA